VGHLDHRAWRGPHGHPYSHVVEGHDTAGRSVRVDQRRIPVVEVPPEVLEKDNRNGPVPDLSIGVVDAARGTDDLVCRFRIGGHRSCTSNISICNLLS
jgi:hypothetical protein